MHEWHHFCPFVCQSGFHDNFGIEIGGPLITWYVFFGIHKFFKISLKWQIQFLKNLSPIGTYKKTNACMWLLCSSQRRNWLRKWHKSNILSKLHVRHQNVDEELNPTLITYFVQCNSKSQPSHPNVSTSHVEIWTQRHHVCLDCRNKNIKT